jgi:hypothetical protein
MSSGETPTSFQEVFRTDSRPRDNFLARLFGIFSEHVVRLWCECPQAPYIDVGRPTIRKLGQSKGWTLDFTLQHRQSGRLFATEMKCWITWEDYRYLQLTNAGQLQALTGQAFVEFLSYARNPAEYQVFVNSKVVQTDGGVLIWGAATPEGRSAAAGQGITDVLTIEEMVDDLHVWRPPAWQHFVDQRRQWAKVAAWRSANAVNAAGYLFH